MRTARPQARFDRTKQPGGRTAAPPGVGTVARSPASVAGVARFVPLRSDGTAAMATVTPPANAVVAERRVGGAKRREPSGVERRTLIPWLDSILPPTFG